MSRKSDNTFPQIQRYCFLFIIFVSIPVECLMYRFRGCYIALSIVPVFAFVACYGSKNDNIKSDESSVFDEETPVPEYKSAIAEVIFPSSRNVGEQIDWNEVESFPIDLWFTIEEIGDSLFGRINGLSFNEKTPVAREDLRYLRILHTDFEGKIRIGELLCHKSIAGDLREIFLSLYKTSYPIESVRLIDDFAADDNASMVADNTSCFNTRTVPGSHKFSKHAYGMAVDINPFYNPLVKVRDGRQIVLPEDAAPFVDRTAMFDHKIDAADFANKEFRRHGFKWGGNWRSVKDYQHFEK